MFFYNEQTQASVQVILYLGNKKTIIISVQS